VSRPGRDATVLDPSSPGKVARGRRHDCPVSGRTVVCHSTTGCRQWSARADERISITRLEQGRSRASLAATLAFNARESATIIRRAPAASAATRVVR
jgi:hypothetical protein